MPDIRIHRDHQLGLAKARKVAWQWAEQVESKFDMECTVIEGETSDTVEFTRSGVNGTLIVAADHFDLTPSWASCWAPSPRPSNPRSEEPRRLLGRGGGAKAARKGASRKK
jgi:hypothetical protein